VGATDLPAVAARNAAVRDLVAGQSRATQPCDAAFWHPRVPGPVPTAATTTRLDRAHPPTATTLRPSRTPCSHCRCSLANASPTGEQSGVRATPPGEACDRASTCVRSRLASPTSKNQGDQCAQARPTLSSPTAPTLPQPTAFDGLLTDPRCLAGVLRDLADRDAHLLRPGRHRLHVVADLLGSGPDHPRPAVMPGARWRNWLLAADCCPLASPRGLRVRGEGADGGPQRGGRLCPVRPPSDRARWLPRTRHSGTKMVSAECDAYAEWSSTGRVTASSAPGPMSPTGRTRGAS
jgi:hypothetical protein